MSDLDYDSGRIGPPLILVRHPGQASELLSGSVPNRRRVLPNSALAVYEYVLGTGMRLVTTELVIAPGNVYRGLAYSPGVLCLATDGLPELALAADIDGIGVGLAFHDHGVSASAVFGLGVQKSGTDILLGVLSAAPG